MPARNARGSRVTPLDLADGLHSAAIHLLRRLRRQDDASGLSAPQLSALSVIVFGGPITLGALATLLIAVVAAPPRIFDLLRAELRAPKIRGVFGTGRPIGAAITYCYALLCTPYVIWIGMIVVRVLRGATTIDVPPVAFTPMLVAYAMIAVASIRARRVAG